MKGFKILTLIFLCSIVHLNKIYAQKDYVVTKNNDTIFCKIRTDQYGEYSLAYKYRVNKNGNFVNIDSNIIAYHLANDSSVYLLKSVPGFKSRIYLKKFLSGRINLYAYAYEPPPYAYGPPSLKTGGNAETYLFADKGEDGLVQIKHTYLAILGDAHSQKDEQAAFLNLISDNPDLLEKFKKNSTNFYYILKCVKMYNSEYLVNNKSGK